MARYTMNGSRVSAYFTVRAHNGSVVEARQAAESHMGTVPDQYRPQKAPKAKYQSGVEHVIYISIDLL